METTENKKKVAILTQYYESVNYGGNLQAYALPCFLIKNGYDAKQVSYSVVKDTRNISAFKKIKIKLKESPWGCFKSVLGVSVNKIRDFFHKKDLANIKSVYLKRYEKFKNFQLNLIPHTDKEYFDDDLAGLNDEFNFFIVGSDQVFNFDMAKEGFFLNFVDSKKPKMSYAASMAMKSISSPKKEFLKDTFKSYKAVGVREEKTQDLLKPLTEKEIELNVDPVFLLNSKDWDKIAADRLTDEKYVFCYFLGNNPKGRKAAKTFAFKYGLKIACVPFYKTRYRVCDTDFGDINMPYALPEEFISLIKHAEYVFTDSFHACAFSFIYNKRFVVFNRDKKGTMNSRIISLTRLFKEEERFIKNGESIKSVENILLKNADFHSDDFIALKEKSVDFLLRNLK